MMNISVKLNKQEKSHLCRFGESFPNKGWIECISKTFSNKTYYYNVYTRCSTWIRPLPDNIPLPKDIVSKCFKTNIPSEDSDLEFIVSGNSRKSVLSKKSLSHLYTIPEETLHATSDEETEDSYDFKSLSEESVLSIITEARIPEIIYYYPEECSREAKQLYKIVNNNNSSSSSEDDYYCDIPRLKAIDLPDLIIGKAPARARKRKKIVAECKSESSVECVKGRVYEMYGTKTLNYDTDEHEAVIVKKPKIRKLSESSGSSFSSSSSCCSKSCSCSCNGSDSDDSSKKTDHNNNNNISNKSINTLIDKIRQPNLSESEHSD